MVASVGRGIACLLALTSCLAQDAASPAERFDERVRAEIKNENVGLAVAVVSHGQIVYAKGFGSANVETKQPVTVNTVWPITQLSEVYSAIAIAALAKDGVLSLDERIGKYWPQLNSQVGQVTIRQLLQHRAGIKDDHVDFPLLDAGALKKYVLSCDASWVIAEPGQLKSFSSRTGNIAAAVAEHVSGMEFNEILDSRVFRPMGFTRTSLSILQAATQSIAQGHRKGKAGLEVVRPLALNWVGWPTTSVFTSVSEGVSFIGALVNDGEYDGHQVFSQPLVADTLSLLGTDSFTSSTRWAGIQSHYFFLPEKKFGILIFNNAPARNTLVSSISSSARVIWLGEIPVGTSASSASEPIPVTKDQAKELVGVYRNEYLIRLEWREGSLMFHDEGTAYRKPTDWIAVKHLSDNRYLLDKPHLPYGTDLSLVRSDNGSVTHLMHARRAFRKEL